MIRAYWWPGNPRNFGDRLMAVLARRLSGQRIEWTPIESADVILGGSILEIAQRRAPQGTVVWGAGFILPGGPWSGAELEWRAVRGEYSAERLPNRPQALGDPGVLAPLAIDPRQRRHGRSVALPHFADTRLRLPGDVQLHPVLDDPVHICQQIAGASEVWTSSLHGLIVAEAYGVPVKFAPPSVELVSSAYKLDDYRSAGDVALDELLRCAPWT